MFCKQDEEFVKAKFSDVDYDIREDLVKVLDHHPDSWDSLLAVLPSHVNSNFSKQGLEWGRPSFLGQTVQTPMRCLVDELMNLGFTVAQFIAWLEKVELDKALMIIKPDEPLKIEEQPPPDIEVEKDEPLVLHCRASGFPTPTYQWIKDEEELLEQNFPKLSLDHAQLHNSGKYKCRVQNIDRLSGKVNAPCYSQSCYVTVHAPSFNKPSTEGCRPCFDLQPVSPGQSVSQGACILLKCRASSDVPVSYQWFKDNAEISGETWEELSLLHLFPDDETQVSSWSFRCLATNKWGSTLSNSITVTLDAPNQDTQYTARDKVALLFANERYQHLESFMLPSSDVATLSAILKGLGFRVMSYLDLTLSEMRNALNIFCSQLDKGVYGLFYFAGHGFEEHGECYMQPVDASNAYLPEESLCVHLVAESMQRRNPAFSGLLLDMCRERPPAEEIPNQTRRPGRVFQMNSFKDIVFGYATSFLGEAVEVQCHPNGLYMQYLQKYLTQNKCLLDILKDVNKDMSQNLIARSRGQVPWVEGNHWTTTLRDPIVDPHPCKAVFDAQWADICACPKPRSHETNILDFLVRFEPHKGTFCNAIAMLVQTRDKRGTFLDVKLKATFNQPSGMVTVEYDQSTPLVAYIIRDVQRNQGELCCQLSLTDAVTGQELGAGPSIVLQMSQLPINKLGLAENKLNDQSLL